MKVYVLIENTKKEDCLICEHGLSLLIELNGKKYLIDAGSSDAFIKNAEVLSIDLENVDCCFLSHGHYDHSGGFYSYLTKHKDCKLYCMQTIGDAYYSGSNDHIHYIGVPASFKKITNQITYLNTDTKINEDVYCICHHMEYSDIGKEKKLYKKVNEQYQPDDFRHEMSVVFKTDKGLVVVNSCCHAGIENVVREVQEVFHEPIYAFIGGLHMKGKKDGREICTFTPSKVDALSDFINQNKIIVYTGHCTGEIGYNGLKEKVKDIHSLYTGYIFEL